jgi:hypothetical protein
MKKHSFIFIAFMLVAAWLMFTNQVVEKEPVFNRAWLGTPPIDLTQILGKNLNIACDEDRLTLKTAYDKVSHINVIRNQYGDTLLYGQVVKYGKYYFANTPLPNGNFMVSAIDIQPDYIVGLKTAHQQMQALGDSMKGGQYKELVNKKGAGPTVLTLNEALLYVFYQNFVFHSPQYFYEESPHETKTLLIQ